jgi:hypothetical protein
MERIKRLAATAGKYRFLFNKQEVNQVHILPTPSFFTLNLNPSAWHRSWQGGP